MHSRHTVALRVVAAVATTLAFAAPLGAQSGARDSAGIRIFDYRGQPMPAPAFTTGERPVWAKTGGENPDHSVGSASAMTTLRDGRWVVGVGGTRASGRTVYPPPDAPPGDSSRVRIVFDAPTRVREFLVFDSAGAFLARGGTPDTTAPGGLRGAISVVRELPNGTLLVATLAGDASIFRTDGTFERSLMPQMLRFVGLFEDGTMLASRARPVTTPWVDGTLAGFRLNRQTTDYFRVSANGESVTPLPFTTDLPWYTRNPTPLPGATPSPVALAPWPVAAATVAFTSRDVIWLFDRVSWELRAMDARGALTTIVRPPVPELVAKATLGGRYRNDSTYALSMLVDDEGRLWMDAGDNQRPSVRESALRRWLVIDRQRGLLGSIMLQPGFKPLEVRGGLLYGRHDQSTLQTRAVVAFRVQPLRR